MSLEVFRTNEKICVILGAGASADAWNNGGPPRDPAWQPPLAQELFQFGRRREFWEVAKAYPGVRVLASELAESVEAGTATLEAKLLEYFNHPDQRMRDHFKQVPPYLRDLLLRVVQSYTGGISPGSHLSLVMSLLRANHRVAFLDLNYDDYLETALADFDETLAITNIRDYVRFDRSAIVGKIHGSVHWGAPYPRTEDFLRTLPRLPYPNFEIIWHGNRDTTNNWVTPDGQARLYPVLTAPLAGKDHTALACTREHLQVLQTFLADCAHYLVIGTSGQDADLLGFLNQSVASVQLVHYVNYKEQATRECQERIEAVCPRFKAASARSAFPHGLRVYLSSEEFRDFLQG